MSGSRLPRTSRAVAWFNFEHTASALFFVTVATVALLMPAQGDTWWHLRAGEEVWLRQTPPLSDSFSHTVAGGYWPNHEWLTQAVFYGVYRAGGMRLLTAVLAMLTIAAWVLVWRLTPGRDLRRLAFLTMGIVPASIVWSIRPQVLTSFCVALTAWLVARRRCGWLPLLFLVWANLHGAVLLGLAILASAILAAAMVERSRMPGLAAIGAACLLATTLTPLGLSFWTELPASLARIREIGISEWRPPSVLVPVFAPFWMVLIALAAAVVVRLRRQWRACFENPLVCASLALTPLAVTAERNVAPFMMLAVPALAFLVGSPVPVNPAAPVRRERPALNLGIVLSGAAVAIALVASAWTLEWRRLGWHPIPDEAIASVSSCPERLYNRYDEGGYLIWFARTQKVFLDGRQDPYPPELIREQVRVETSGDYEPTFQRYGIGCAFVPTGSLLARRLVDNGWRATYQSAMWSVLSRPPL